MTTTETTEAPAVEPVGPRTATFDAVLLPRFKAEVERLNKVAAKLNVPPLTFTEVERGVRVVKEEETAYAFFADGRLTTTYTVETVTVAIEGDTPRLPGGWRFLGAIEYLEAGNLVHGDDARLAAYRESGPDCDHCGFKRDRAKTVILVNDEGTLTQVGSKCLKDFLGYHGNPERVTWFVDAVGELVDELEDDGPGFAGRRVEYGEPVDVFLAVAAAAVRVKGWKSKAAAEFGGTPTAEWVGLVFDGPPRGAAEAFKAEIREITVTDLDETKAAAIKAWAADLDPGDDNFLGNVKVVLGETYIGWRKRGLATAAVMAYDKAMGLMAERKKEEAGVTSEWVGTVGKRARFEVTVTRKHPYESYYGSGFVVVMEDAAGNVVKTMTSGGWAWGADEGDRLTIKATVKSHDEYRGRPETMLTRVAVEEKVDAGVPCGDREAHAYSRCSCPDDPPAPSADEEIF